MDSQNHYALLPPQLELYADACLIGWSTAVETSKTGGHWAHEELDHINCPELKAILLGLQSLCKDYRHTHIHLRSDNTTAIAYLDRCGSTKFSLNKLRENFFLGQVARHFPISRACKGTS